MLKKTLFLVSSLLISSLSLHADADSLKESISSELPLENLVAGSSEKRARKQRARRQDEALEGESWKPFIIDNEYLEPKGRFFFQANVGIGFLRFAGVKGQSDLNYQIDAAAYGEPLQGRLNYTRTPLYEYNLGMDIFDWLSLALAYQHQGVIDVSSPYQKLRPRFEDGLTNNQIRNQFNANLRLDALFVKNYLNLPKSLIWRSIAINPYLGIGVGLAWQSWSKVSVSELLNFSLSDNDQPELDYNSNLLQFANKYSANAFYMFDLGFSLEGISLPTPFSVRLGCKYNAWGQARSMGKLSQQDNVTISLWKPIHIRQVYQFAPYVGVQWNY